MAARKLSVAQIEDAMGETPAVEPKGLAPIVDIDALIKADLDAVVIVERGPVKVFGETFMVIEPQNSFHQFRLSDLEHDPMAIIDVMKDCIHPDNRVTFIQKMREASSLPPEVLMKVVNAILEVALARPTSPSTPSSRRSPARRK